MLNITSVLVPVDFSRASKKALHYGVHLALRLDAKLITAHIVPSFDAFNYVFPGDVHNFEGESIAEARRRLPQEIPAEYRDRLKTEAIVKCGEVRDELFGIVESGDIDLVVMGTHGGRPLERLFLGSTTEALLRRVSTPILTVPRPAVEEETVSPFEVPFRRIVYATDFSDASMLGFRYCAEFVRALGARLTLLHVMDLRDNAAFGSDEEKMQATLMGRLRKTIESEGCENLQIATEVVRGTPYREILKFAAEHTADLLAINLQNKGLLERALLGSTAERVIRSSRIPVLAIHGVAVSGAK